MNGDRQSRAALRHTRLLRPRVLPDTIIRTRLFDRLDDGLGRPLTLLASPPGFGKTTLLSSWAAQCRVPVAWLRVHGQLTELRAANLRFTADETAAFFERSTKIPLDSDMIARIEQRAEGWPAGLRLAALTLEDGAQSESVLAALEGRRLRGLMEFLTEEVLASQPDDIRRVLLRTSIVEQICAPLAATLIGEGTSEESAEANLSRIAGANLFLSEMDDHSRWYRYHSLFRDALQHRLLTDLGTDRIAELNRTASRWFAANGMVQQAVFHARVAGDDGAAARIVEQNIHVALNHDDVPALELWLSLIPHDVQAVRPALILGRSWAAYQRGNWALHGRLLDDARTSLTAHASSLPVATVAALEGEFEAARSMRLLDAGDGTGAAEAAHRALKQLPPEHRYVISLAYHQQAFAELMLGRHHAAVQHLRTFLDGYDRPPDVVWVRTLLALMRVHARSGNLEDSRQAADHVLRLATEYGFLAFRSWADYQLGAIAYESNELDLARRHFSAVVDDPHRAHSTPLRDAAFGLALIHRSSGRSGEAWRTLDQLQEFFRWTGSIEQATLARALQSRFTPNGSDDTLTVLNSLGLGRWPAGLVGMLGDPSVVRIEALLTQATAASLAEAESLLESHLREARALHVLRAEIELLALQSVLVQSRGQFDRAVTILESALAPAERAGFVRPFVDRGPVLRPILRAISPRARSASYAKRLLEAFDAEAIGFPGHGEGMVRHSVAPDEALVALTDREVQILEMLASRLTYKEIATALTISPFTVKGHVSNIYAKFNASGRRDALAKARSSGLLAGFEDRRMAVE